MASSHHHKVVSKLAAHINHEVKEKGPLLSVVIFYETAQSCPALYLAYETLEHCMDHLRGLGAPEAVAKGRDALDRQLKNDRDAPGHGYAEREVIESIVGPLLNPGYWVAPADDLLTDEPDVAAWAADLFGTNLTNDQQANMSSDDRYAQLKRLNDTLWLVLDEARRTNTSGWPPISFVMSFDNETQFLLPATPTAPSTSPHGSTNPIDLIIVMVHNVHHDNPCGSKNQYATVGRG